MNGLENFGACGYGALDDFIDVGEIHVKTYRTGANGDRARMAQPHAWIFIGQHDVRIADLQFSVGDFAARLFHAHHFSGAKNIFVIFNGLRGPFDNQIRRNGVVPLGNMRNFAHDFLLIELVLRVEVTARGLDARVASGF